uniref:E3 ubiquitin-protein ligase BRE1A-like n=1 Tax=Phallusia mammillata TaxID=59560 RepID=A0A6F9DRL8_9ASCI|nr:E3 ubiquitin-protein ligase BRE1A-like [Phallusia mammillata]
MSWYPQQNRGLTQQQMPLPPGWEAKYDPTNRKWFYMNHQTKTTQWDDPRLTMQMQPQQTQQPQGQRYGQQAQKPQNETSFIEADPSKVKTLLDNFDIDVEFARELLRKNQNNVSSSEGVLKSMGYTRKRPVAVNEVFVTRIHKDFPSADKETIRDILKNNRNDFIKTVTSLKEMGHERKVEADERLAQQFKEIYKDANIDVIRSVLVQVQNNGRKFRTEIEKMGFVKGGKKIEKPKPVKKEMSESDKRKMQMDMKAKFPELDKYIIELCLISTDYNFSVAEMVLKQKQKEKKKSTPTKTPPKSSYEMPSDDLYTSKTQEPVVFGEESKPIPTPKLNLFDMNKLSASTSTTFTSFTTPMKPATVVKPRIIEKTHPRTKKLVTAKKATYQPKMVDWKTSENRTKPNGPNPALRMGPDPSLLITDYFTPSGPNKEYYSGPQATNRCGPLPSNRNGPAGLSVGPMNCVV